MKELVLGLGSNLGNRQLNIETAIRLIGERIGKILSVSSFVETVPWGYLSDNQYLNGVLIVDVQPVLPGGEYPSGLDILTALQSIEREMGRIRTIAYSDRIIDIDILFYGLDVMDVPGLRIPHPLIADRDFVLVSLMEICPERIHPVNGLSIKQLWESRKLLPDT